MWIFASELPHSPFVPAEAGSQGQAYKRLQDWVPGSAGTNGDSLGCMRRPWTAFRHIHHLLKEPLGELVPDVGASRLLPEIVQLVWVGGEVIELAPGHVAIDADAPAMVDQRAHRELGR